MYPISNRVYMYEPNGVMKLNTLLVAAESFN